MRAMKESTEELRKEVIQKKQEIKNLREDVASKQKQLVKEQKELEELLEFQVGLKVCRAQSMRGQTLCGHKTPGKVSYLHVGKRAIILNHEGCCQGQPKFWEFTKGMRVLIGKDVKA